MDTAIKIKRKDILKRLGLSPVLIALLFLFFTVPIYAVITGFNFTEVGAAIYSTFSVGATTFASYSVGGYSTNEASNTLAQTLFPIIGVVIIIGWGLKALAHTDGLDGFIKTMLVFVLGAILLGAIVVILGQLT